MNVMKVMIRWLCEISGVEKEIRLDERKQIGGEMQDCAYWLSNVPKYGYLYPLFSQIANRLKGNYFLRGDFVREKVNEWIKHQESGELIKWFNDRSL